MSPSSDRILTGGQEKKARIFDLGKPDAAPDFLGGDATTTCHEGTIRSVVWVSESVTVTAGEDGFVKCVFFFVCLESCVCIDLSISATLHAGGGTCALAKL